MMAEEFLPQEASDSEINISNQSDSSRERIKHLLVGSPKVVTRTIQSLHVAGYAEVREWSKLQSAGELGKPGEVVSVLLRYILPK